MQLHQLKPIHKTKKRKRVGRGGKRGTYSGRGIKGQRARAGRKFVPIIRELIKKYPKLKSYRFKSKMQNPKSKMTTVNLEKLERRFNQGEVVSPKTLLEKEIISKVKGRMPRVKILGKGGLTKNLIIENCEVSESAKEKTEKAGGVVK